MTDTTTPDSQAMDDWIRGRTGRAPAASTPPIGEELVATAREVLDGWVGLGLVTSEAAAQFAEQITTPQEAEK